MRIKFLIIDLMIINYQTIFRLFDGHFTIILLIIFLIFFGKIFFNILNLIAQVSFKVYLQFFFRQIKYLMSNQLINLWNHYFITHI